METNADLTELLRTGDRIEHATVNIETECRLPRRYQEDCLEAGTSIGLPNP